MELNVNDERYSFDGENVLDLIRVLNLEQKKGIALALNNAIVPKQHWNETPLEENDTILIITAAAGG